MPRQNSCVTVHMAASLDGFVAKEDGREALTDKDVMAMPSR